MVKSETTTKEPSVREAMVLLARAIMEIDLATSTDDPYLRNEIRFVKDRVVDLYATIEGRQTDEASGG